MLLRRLASLALSIPLLHLNVARADAACASHAIEKQPQAKDLPAMDHHAHHAAPERAPSSEEAPCDAPRARDCCASLASCAVSFDTNVAETELEWSIVSVAISTRPLRAPASSVDAPEPPPPRA